MTTTTRKVDYPEPGVAIFGPPPPGGPQKNSELNVHKISMFWPKNGAFSCKGGGQGPLAPAPGSAPTMG